jgi:hypothetical protein
LLSFPDATVPAQAVSIEINPANPNLSRQMGDQIDRQSVRIQNALKDYIQQRLAHGARQLAHDAIERLKSRLPKSYPLFGLDWEVKNTRVVGRNAPGVCFDLQDSNLHSIQNVCVLDLDASQLPKLSWAKASIDRRMVDWLRGEVNGLSRPPYFSVGLISAALQDGKLVGNATVSLLDAATSVPIRVELASPTVNVALSKEAIVAAVLAAARSQAASQIKDQEIAIGQFSLSRFTLPDTGSELTISGEFRNGDWLSGSVEIELYPRFKIKPPKVAAGPALAKLVSFDAGPVKFEAPSLDPLAIRAAVELKNVEFLSSAGVAIPKVHIEVPLHGTPRIIEPIEVRWPGDIPIGPFTLTNSSIALYPQTKPLAFQAKSDFTVATGAMANVIKIHSELTADIGKRRFDFTGPMSVLNTTEIARTDGHIDIGAGIANIQSKSSGWVEKLVPASTESVLDGRRCRFTENADGRIATIGVSVRGSLAIQAPCGDHNDECPARGLGAACISGNVQLGPLGNADGQVGAALDFRSPVAGVRIRTLDLGIAKPSVDVKVAARYSRAAFDVGPLSITVYAPSIQDISRGLLRRLLEDALKPHFSLDALKSGKIILSLLPESAGSTDPDSDFDEAQKQVAANPAANGGAPPSAAPARSATPANAVRPFETGSVQAKSDEKRVGARPVVGRLYEL